MSEDTRGTYKTSSFWEVSIIRSDESLSIRDSGLDLVDHKERLHEQTEVYHSIESASRALLQDKNHHLLQRPCSSMEPHRLHCNEMINLTTAENESNDKGLSGSKG
jgi:hypothetical protein